MQVQLDRLCGHECRILGRRGAFWPQPTFVITAADQPQAPLEAKSATGAWNAVLARINAAIVARCVLKHPSGHCSEVHKFNLGQASQLS